MEALEQTEYLKLVHRYLSQAHELEKLANDKRVIEVKTCDAPNVADLLRVLGFRMRGGCGSEVVLETVNAARAFLTTDSGFPVNQLEEALRTSEENFRLLVEGVGDHAILMLDPFGRVVSWNQGAQRIKGWEPIDIIGKHFSHFYVPEDVASGQPERDLELAAAEGRTESEGWRVRSDGQRFWAETMLSAVRDHEGALRGFANVTRDRTENHQARARLETFAELNRERATVNTAGPSGAGMVTRSDSGPIAARLVAGTSGPSASTRA